MPKEPGEPKQKIEPAFENLEQKYEPVLEVNELKIETKPPQEIEKPEDTEKQLEKLIGEIEKIIKAEEPVKIEEENPEIKKARIEQYQDRYLPDYLRGKRGFVERTLTRLWTGISGKCEKEGTENIPERGPYIIVGNHFGGGDTEAVLDTFKDTNLHFAIAKEMWWNSNPIQRWLLKKFGMIPVEESLSNLSEQEKEEALKRQGGNGKKVFRKIIDREKMGGVPANVEFVRQAVAVLSRGDSIGVYPEGLWLRPGGIGKSSREHKEMKQGYRGIELIASQYKKLTGEELPIIPTAYIEDAKTKTRKLIVGQQLKLSENDTDLNGTDWAMTRVAEMLPEEQRGYYKDKVKK